MLTVRFFCRAIDEDMKTIGPVLSLSNISKAFGPVQALQAIDLNIFGGEILAIIGENGAGKSTLMKILSGSYQPDEGGSMLLDGRPYHPSNPAEGRAAGISMIYQELNLALHLSIEENIMLGIETANWGWIRSQEDKVKEILSWLGHTDLAPETRVGKLGIGQQQLVEIARALASEARIVIMDEPTSSLSREDSQSLFKVIRQLRNKGITVIYISHFLEEVTEIADRYVVLRDGELVADGDVAGTSLDEMIEHMVGRSVEELYPHIAHKIGDQVLEVKNLTVESGPENVSFTLCRGEILGIAGLVGAGRSETVRALFGLEGVQDGIVSIAEHPQLTASWFSPPRALNHSLDYLSENRKEEGLALNLSITSNVTLSNLGKYSRMGLLRLKEEAKAAIGFVDRLGLKYRDVHQNVSDLSGGNQQKASIARLLHHNSDIFFLDEPTRGIDVGSKAEIYRIIHQLAAQGKSIVMVSSYLPELFGVCDSLAVMHRGSMSPTKPITDWDERSVMLFATSGRMKAASNRELSESANE